MVINMPQQREPIRQRKYACTECGREVGADNLVTRQVAWRTLGGVRRTLRTRSTAWLCMIKAEDGSPSCLDKDPQWAYEPFVDAPGNADTRAAKEKQHG